MIGRANPGLDCTTVLLALLAAMTKYVMIVIAILDQFCRRVLLVLALLAAMTKYVMLWDPFDPFTS